MRKISNNKIAEAIYLVLKDHNNDPKIFPKIINFLNKQRLISKSNNILNQVENIKNKNENILKVLIHTAKNLENNLKQDIINILSKKYNINNKNIILKEKIDEKLISGFKLVVNDEVLDLTALSKLKKLEKHLTR